MAAKPRSATKLSCILGIIDDRRTEYGSSQDFIDGAAVREDASNVSGSEGADCASSGEESEGTWIVEVLTPSRAPDGLSKGFSDGIEDLHGPSSSVIRDASVAQRPPVSTLL